MYLRTLDCSALYTRSLKSRIIDLMLDKVISIVKLACPVSVRDRVGTKYRSLSVLGIPIDRPIRCNEPEGSLSLPRL